MQWGGNPMTTAVMNLLIQLKDPKKGVSLTRKGLKVSVIEAFLAQEGFLVKDVWQDWVFPLRLILERKKRPGCLYN